MSNFLSTLKTAWALLPEAEKAFSIFDQIDAIDGGGLFDKINAVLLANGINVASMVASATGTASGGFPDLTTIKGIQTALNTLGASPVLNVDGSIGTDTAAAILAFQVKQGLDRTRCPDVATVAAIKAKLR